MGQAKRCSKGVLHYKKPTLWILLAVLIFGIVAGSCLLIDRPEQGSGSTEQTQPPTPREHMDQLLDTILDQTDLELRSNPNQCVMLNRETYQELLAYDDLMLSYFIPHLRQTETYGEREYLMAWACSDLTGVGFGASQYSSSWWAVPQQWVVAYDRSVSVPNSDQRLRPGIYHTVTLNRQTWSEYVYHGQSRDSVPLDYTYYVTADSFIRVKGPIYGSSVIVQREKVDWKWESPFALSGLQTPWAKELHTTLNKSLAFLKGTDIEKLLWSEDCLYQKLENGRCLIWCEDELYLIQSDYGTDDFSRVLYVCCLECSDYT